MWWAALTLAVLGAGIGTTIVKPVLRAGRAEADAERARLEAAARSARHRDLPGLDALTGTAFELYVADLCVRDGFHVTQAGGGAGDLGADVIAIAPDGRRIVIQCKRYKAARAVPGPDIQRFLGTVRAVHRADVPVFVTTAWRFTRQSTELAASQGVVLIGRDLLSHWNNGMSLERLTEDARAAPKRAGA